MTQIQISLIFEVVFLQDVPSIRIDKQTHPRRFLFVNTHIPAGALQVPCLFDTGGLFSNAVVAKRGRRPLHPLAVVIRDCLYECLSCTTNNNPC